MLSLAPLLLFFFFAADPARLNNDAAALYRQGNYQQAERMYLDALAAAQGRPRVFRATLHANLATLYKREARYADAETHYRIVLDLRREALGGEDPATAIAMNNLAELLRIVGRYDESRALFERALLILRQSASPVEADIALVLNNLSEVHRAAGRYTLAERQLRESLEIKHRLYGPRHAEVAMALNNLAQVLEDVGDLAQSEQLLLEALDMWRGRPEQAMALANLARLYVREKRTVEAADYLQRARQAIDHGQRDQLLDAALRHTAGKFALLEGRNREAVEDLRQSLAIRERVLGATHPVIAPLLLDYAGALRAARRKVDAARMESRALRMIGGVQSGTIDIRALRSQ